VPRNFAFIFFKLANFRQRQISQNKMYERRKLCASVTDESDIVKNADFRNLRQLTRSPIRSISEASDFVAKLPKDNPPAIPPRPHERSKSTASNVEVNLATEIEKI